MPISRTATPVWLRGDELRLVCSDVSAVIGWAVMPDDSIDLAGVFWNRYTQPFPASESPLVARAWAPGKSPSRVVRLSALGEGGA